MSDDYGTTAYGAKQTFAETRRSARRQLDSEFYIG
jgi:hypothetical protein